MSLSHARRISLAFLFTAAAWLALQQASLLLTQIQQQDAQAYGISALGGGLMPRGLTQTARDAIKLWTSPGVVEAADSFVHAYTVIDLLLIAAYVWLFAEIMKQFDVLFRAEELDSKADDAGYAEPLWRSQGGGWFFARIRPILWLAIFDALENLARLTAYETRARNSWPGSENVFVWAAWLFGKIKLVFLVVVLFTIAAAVRDLVKDAPKRLDAPQQRAEDQPAQEQEQQATGPSMMTQAAKVIDDAPFKRYATALAVLRAQVVLALAFAFVLLVDLTGQAGDILRRWADGPVSAWVSLVLGVLLVVLLTMVLWSSCRRIILAKNQSPWFAKEAKRSSIVLSVAFAASLVVGALLWQLLDSRIPWALPILLFIVMLPEVARILRDQSKLNKYNKDAKTATDLAADKPEPKAREAYQRTARLLALVPAAVLGLGLVRSATGPVILSSLPDAGYQAPRFYLLLAGGLAVLLVVPTWAVSVLSDWDENGELPSFEGRHGALIVITGVLVVALLVSPLVVPPAIGSVGVLAIVLSALGLLFAELQRLTEISVPPQGLTMLGFTKVPVFILLAIWFAAASQLDNGSYHRVRTLQGSPAPTSLGQLWSEWRDANCLDTAQGPVPLVLVAAEGGGIRAAYWTASVLTDMLADTPLTGCPTRDARARVFAVSSVSGGSLGTVAYLANPDARGQWYRRALGEPDYVATPLARGFGVDVPRALVGFDSLDRAAWLEKAWERWNTGLDQSYFSTLAPGGHAEGWMPLTILNGTQVETGCRVNTSAVRLATDGEATPIDCRSMTGREHRLTIPPPADGSDGGPTRAQTVPAAPITVDILDHTCSNSFAVSTAALLSARFPFITPSGQLPCKSTRVHVVDGGYADGAGMAAVSDLWAQLEPFVAAHNARLRTGQGMVVPLLVHIDNHYQSQAALAPPSRTPELLTPLRARQRAAATRDPGREQQAGSSFTVTVPGTTGWHCDLTVLTKGTGQVLLAPRTRPGLPAPLAWTLARTSRQDLDNQRADVFEAVGTPLRGALTGAQPISCADAPAAVAGG